jgi:hypothetical protein
VACGISFATKAIDRRYTYFSKAYKLDNGTQRIYIKRTGVEKRQITADGSMRGKNVTCSECQ